MGWSRHRAGVLTLCWAIACWAAPLGAQNFVTAVKSGQVDWTNGIVEASGTGRQPKNPLNTAQARAVAEKEAQERARENLTEVLGSLRIDSESRIGGLDSGAFLERGEMQDRLHKAQVVNLSYLNDGAVEATVAIRLSGELLEAVLPVSIKPIRPVQQPDPPKPENREVFSGLVIDARGIGVQPALVMRIEDEEGAEVYGPTFISREHAVSQGVVKYGRDLEQAGADPRVAPNPLTLRAIRTASSAPCDIVISNADAKRVRGAAGNLLFLQKCRVIIVFD